MHQMARDNSAPTDQAENMLGLIPGRSVLAAEIPLSWWMRKLEKLL